MRLLLDTHALLWFLADSRKLSLTAKAVIEDPANERLLSPINLLEIAIKIRIDKLRLNDPFGKVFPSSLTANRIHLLPIEARHIEPHNQYALAPPRPLRSLDRRHRSG